MVGDRAGGARERVIAPETAAALIGGLELGQTENAARGVPRPGSVQAALVEGAPEGMAGPEQGSRQCGLLSRPGGPGAAECEHRDGVDDGGERGAFHPAGRRLEAVGEQLTAADLVPVSEDDQGEPGLQLSTRPVPPRRRFLVQPGQDPRAVAGRRGHIAFAPVQIRTHQGQPRPRVAESRAPLGLGVFGLLQVPAGVLQITHPEPDRGEHPVDEGEVAPRAQLLPVRSGVFQGRDRGRVVRPELGQFGQLDQHGRRSPGLPQGAEGRQGLPAFGLGKIDAAEHLVERAAHQRHGRPYPRVR